MEVMLLRVLFVNLLMIFSPAQSSDSAIDLRLIAGKSQAEVENVLGKPTSEDYIDPLKRACPCKRILYKGNLIAITFINNQADWIWISQGVNVSNIDAANVKQYHKFNGFIIVKVRTIDNNVCCGL
jgi:hypothetical protein